MDEFELGAGPAVDGYSRKLVEFCSSRVLGSLCRDGAEKVADPSFNRLTFDMMLAWECPGCNHEEPLLVSIFSFLHKIQISSQLFPHELVQELFFLRLM